MRKLVDSHIEYMNLPYHLKLLRAKYKYDIEYVAKYCKTSRRKVRAWENGLLEPTITQLECLTVLYDTSMDLICGTLQSKKLVANQAITNKEVTVEELMLIRMYHSLSEKSQNIVKHFIEKLFTDEMQKTAEMYSELEVVLKSNDIEKFAQFIEKYKG